MPSLSFADEVYVNSLIEKSRSISMSDDKQWETLLHYKYNFLSGNRSLIDDERFFLSDDGKHNKQAELEATINAIFADNGSIVEEEHAYCVFPARRNYIIERLGVDESQLPAITCTRYEELKRDMDPTSVTLVFPFMYVSRPASMFGHTLLRLNNSTNQPLLAYAVTYGAVLPEEPSFLDKTINGIIGLMPAVYSMEPYSKTIYEYANLDKRDIWEYNLNLSKEETLKLFDHLYELQNILSDYWFFDENCSYNLLMLFEVVRPDVELATTIFYEAPTDTVKVMYEAGMITGESYRPSLASKIDNIARALPAPSIDLALDVGTGVKPIDAIASSDFSDRLKASMYDLAVEVMQDRYVQKGLSDEETWNAYNHEFITYLQARAKLGVKTNYRPLISTPPHLGHDIQRVTLGAGTYDGRFFTEVGYRVSFHSLYDVDAGYIANSEISALDFNLRWDSVRGDIKLNNMKIVGLKTLIPISRTLTEASYRVELAGKQKQFKDGEKFVTYIDGGVGLTYELLDDVYVWGLAIAEVAFSSGYENGYGIGVGGDVGISYELGWGKTLAEVDYTYYVLGKGEHDYGAILSYVLPVTQNNSVLVQFERRFNFDEYYDDISLSWRYYF